MKENKHSNEISFSLLREQESKNLLNARDNVNDFALKEFGFQFSDDFEKNKKLLILFFPILNSGNISEIELGLSYYYGSLLAHVLPQNFNLSWKYSGVNLRLEIETKFGAGSAKLNGLENKIEKIETLDAYLNWHKMLYVRYINHNEAVLRYKAQNNGKKPVWWLLNINNGCSREHIPTVESLKIEIKEYPNLSLSDFINQTPILSFSLSEVYVDHVALYLNCKKIACLRDLKASDLFHALWQCSR
jgi:hypothetical protein